MQTVNALNSENSTFDDNLLILNWSSRSALAVALLLNTRNTQNPSAESIYFMSTQMVNMNCGICARVSIFRLKFVFGIECGKRNSECSLYGRCLMLNVKHTSHFLGTFKMLILRFGIEH